MYLSVLISLYFSNLSIYFFICLSMYLLISLPKYQSLSQSLSVCLSFHLSVFALVSGRPLTRPSSPADGVSAHGRSRPRGAHRLLLRQLCRRGLHGRAGGQEVRRQAQRHQEAAELPTQQ